KLSLEIKELLQALGLLGVLRNSSLLNVEALIFFAQGLVLTPQRAKIHVVMPAIARTAAQDAQHALAGRNDARNPKTNQAHRAGIGMHCVYGTLDLHRQGNDLKQKDGSQHHGIAVTAKEIFHEKLRR